jgi:glycosyltransferase involved in cell wall biosynthesis
MRILKVIHGYPPEYQAGSEVYTQSLCNELVAQGHTVAVCCREENPYLPDFTVRTETLPNGLTLHRFNLPREKDGYRHPGLDLAFAQAVRAFAPDVAHLGHLNHLSTGWVEVLKAQGVRMVYTLHDFWLMCPRGQFLQTNFTQPDYYRLCEGQEDAKCARECYRGYWGCSTDDPDSEAYWTRWVAARMAETRKAADLIDLFIAPARSLQRRFIDGFGVPEAKIRYLDYGFPLHYLQPSTAPRPDRPFTFGYIGTHIPPKGVDLLIGAFLQLSDLAVRLIIWGRPNGPSTTHLRRLADQSGGRIEFRGEYLNPNIATEVFAQIDAIVVPSVWVENSPLVIHEAQACRIPVITANAGGMAEYVQHGVNGLLFEHRNPLALASCLRHAATHPDELRTLARRGYLYSPDGNPPSIQSHAATLVQWYREV